ncbi:hypothetical protein E1B28_003987 [Marasmius oreades]|uniref:Cyclin-domain-containing protein n=1 Tax=Marasmius oreades TaxID=181124 RepID=A0A9P8ABI7_9AGAR|nr:uncharacterized protein E1B28_003987 [Marasmius oreades]KAG7096566.1 hypothetical protein E1B28_003987 [Marasmius oreades]
MLALAHPYDPSSEVAHRASSSSIPRQRPSHRKPSSSSSCSASASSSRHSSLSTMPSISTSTTSRHAQSSQEHHHQQQPPPPPTHNSARPQQPKLSVSSFSSTSTSAKAASIPVPPVVNTAGTFDIHSYPSIDLLRLLASLLSQIAAANDKLDSPSSVSLTQSHSVVPSYAPPSPSIEHAPFWRTLTTASRSALATPSSTLTFHARNIPTITLEAYLLRILKYCPTTNEVFLSLLVYFDRMSKLSADATGKTFVIDSYNIHRLVIAGVTVASKFFSDVFYTNSRYAKVGGLPLAELNQLELHFLLLNDFRLVIPKDEMQRYAEQLILFSTSTSPSSSPPTASPDSVHVHSSIRPDHPNPSPGSTSSTSDISTYSSSGSSTVVRGSNTSPSSSHTGYEPIPETSETQSLRMCVMGAIDAYGGKIPGATSTATVPGAYATTDSTTTTTSAKVVTGSASIHRDTGFGHGINGTSVMKTPRRGSDASSVYSVSSQSDVDTETEGETETDGGWTTDDEPTIRPAGHRGSICGSISGDSNSSCSFDEVDSRDTEVDDVGKHDVSSRALRRNGRSGGSEGDEEGDDEKEDDAEESMDFDDEGGSNRAMVVDVERTPDSERIRRGGEGVGIDVNRSQGKIPPVSGWA